MKKTLIILEKILLAVLCGILFAAPFNKHLVVIFYYLALALWLVLNILKYKRKFYKEFFPCTYSSITIAVFFLAAIISTIFSLNPYHSQEILFQRYLPYFILFFLGVDLTRNSISPIDVNLFGKRVFLSNVSIITGFFLLLAAIIGIGGVWDYFRFHPDRLWTFFGKEISFKMLPVYLAYFIPFSLSFFIHIKNKLLKIIGFIIFGLLFCVLICNGSRGAWLAVIVFLIFAILFSKKRSIYLFFFFLITVTVFLMPKHYQQRVKTILQPFNEDMFVARKELFNLASSVFITKPVFGSGVGMYEFIDSPVKKVAGQEVHLHAHNTYLEILSEMGAVGFLVFLWIFMVFFKNLFKSIRLCQNINIKAIQAGLAGSIIASLIFALTCTIITVGFQDAVLFWILFGVSSGLASRDVNNTVLSGKVLT